ncbi:YbjN domain-containing protein [uncultured Ruminococcus sp.]|uniref:YbjN domain-containing protein n=1 Tax=uncultured Ruminococcus sp. TaxID=165186 RepID=UPI00266BA8A3|nr:YbjN domain-containing protein [uncultured Ruminococcus sp.]
MSYSTEIASQMVQYFEDDNAHYEFDEERGTLSANYSMDDDCAISSARLFALVHDNGFTIYTKVRGINAKKKNFGNLALFLAYVNDGMRYGNFEFDLDDGEVVFKYSSIVPEGADLDYDYFDHIVLLSLAMLDKYADGLIAMMLGYSDDPEGAYKKCMENDD